MSYRNVDKKMPPKGLRWVAAFGVVASLLLPTYWVAFKLNFSWTLGSLIPGFPIYYPGQLFSWGMRLASTYPVTFFQGGLAVITGLVISVLIWKKADSEK